MHELIKNLRKIIKEFIDSFPITDTAYARIMHLIKVGRILHLNPPETFNEKIHWINLFGDIEQFSHLVDKVSVREFVEKQLGEEYLKPVYGVYNNVEEIAFDTLPSVFVLKATHGSGWTFLFDKNKKPDIRKVNKILSDWLSTNYYNKYRERVYKNIVPRIIAEKFIDPTGSMVDYKFFCFNGRAEYINTMVEYWSPTGYLAGDYYDRNWQHCEFTDGRQTLTPLQKPENLEHMIDISEKLARQIPFVRVDLISSGKEVFFGEMTFTPVAGYTPFNPHEWDKKFGDLINLSLI